MSGITSGIGLISGINTSQLIDQLMAIERRPITNLEIRAKAIDTQRAKFMELSAKLLAARNAVGNFGKPEFFNRFNAATSNDAVLRATASDKAVPGSTTLRVHSLVSNHVSVSRGFADSDRTALGVGTLTIEGAQASVRPDTDLDALNGGLGIRRGKIRITDASGTSAEIDLSRAFTVNDVLDAINVNGTVRVEASVTGLPVGEAIGDRIVLQDLSGGTGAMTVAEVAGGSTASGLGIFGTSVSGRLDGRDVLGLSLETPLSMLNDGNGVDRFGQGAQGDDLSFETSFGNFGVLLTDVLRLSTDLRQVNGGNGVRLGVIRITDRTGATADVDLSAARTVLDVRDAINNAGLAVTATTVNSRFLITDTATVSAEAAKKLKIEDVSGFAAEDLGIAGEVEGSSINGRDIQRVSTVGDLIRAINYAPGNDALVEAAISADGNGITLRPLGFENTVTIRAGQDDQGNISGTAKDLGLADATFSTNEPLTTRRLLAGLNTVLLNTLRGGAGVAPGVISVTDAANQTATIDLSTATTLQDLVDLINADSTTAISASLNRAGNGIELRDESGGTSPVVVADVNGSAAAQLGIAGTFDPATADDIRGANLQRQYITRQSAVSELNHGAEINSGTIRIVDSLGVTHAVNISENLKTVGSVVDFINAVTADTLSARINDSGDGILITDTSAGAKALTISDEEGGSTAEGLNLAGTAKAGQNYIDGSLEARVDIGPSDTLKSVLSKINAAGGDFSAAIVNDGGAQNPFSLTLSSTVSGRRGALLVDTRGLDLGLETLTEAKDAVVSIGGAGATAFLVTSSSNQLTNAMEGVSIDLLSAKDEDVTITVGQDVDGIIESVQGFVTAYNDIQAAIDDATSFNPDTLVRGVLFGDPTVATIQSRLQRVVTQGFAGAGSITRLFQIGIRIGENNRLEFDEERFREVYENSPTSVEELFAQADTGLGAVLQETIDGMTRDFDGVLARKDHLLSDQQDGINDRIESLSTLLASKRKRLEAQFANLETTLAALQDQQGSLSVLSQL
jgi:flagellar hook-associated protein 2